MDANLYQTNIHDEILGNLYYHLFGNFFDTTTFAEKRINLSKFN